jgi:hypothetical protein
LRQVAQNEFELPALKIEYSDNEPGAFLCMSVKAWFNEVSNFGDAMLYENLPDRYALLAWCSSPEQRHRFDENRVATLSEFKEMLSKPFAIRLNHKPFPPGSSYPMIHNNVRPPREADVKEVEKLVRDRGEQHLLAISVKDSDHADVVVSVGDATRFQGMRVYNIVRKEGAWQIESVVAHPNMSSFTFW